MKQKLSTQVNEENKIGEVISFKDDLNCFEWDSLLVIMAIYLNDMAEKQLGIELPKEIDYTWESDSTAILLFLKDKKVVHSMPQKPTVSREIFDAAKSVKSYYFLELLNNYGDGSYYVIIPKEKAIFETYPLIYHENGKEVSNPKYGLGVKAKN
ncbi:hypothetical protein [Flavobacterium sp. YJ01]|uniref:hypothetical protein n=1 Tax=unclassified Flavobacterium TaxID=196869 RepID=UPI0023E3DF14|nr:hypothetical protein [Flavobacterium sp. YJ01]WET02971.1 hypothetical protein P0R33_01310 [Flavobacterium sp. YJ01]